MTIDLGSEIGFEVMDIITYMNRILQPCTGKTLCSRLGPD